MSTTVLTNRLELNSVANTSLQAAAGFWLLPPGVRPVLRHWITTSTTARLEPPAAYGIGRENRLPAIRTIDRLRAWMRTRPLPIRSS